MIAGTVASSELNLKLKDVYTEVDQLFLSTSEGYRNAKRSPSSPEIDSIAETYEPAKYIIRSNLCVQVWAHDMRLQSAFNYFLAKSLDEDDHSRSESPSLSSDDAFLRAKEYLSKSKLQTPSNLVLKTLQFNKRYASCWEVRWIREIEGYTWDDLNPAELESAYVIFHEKLGLISVGCNIFSPQPKSFIVKLAKEDAITKAAKYAPLVARTPFYAAARRGGFEISQVKSCELKIAAPNWLLDPRRAVWVRDKPPQETRLCWIVRFTTHDINGSERSVGNMTKPLKLIPPDILIYLDAETGEVVGANFS